MTRRQAAWASTHDWFEDAVCIEGEFTVGVVESGSNLHADGTKSEYTEYLLFADFDQLYAWAGY